MSFLKGQFSLSLFVPILIGLLYAGTGGWTAERWNGALAIMGLGASAKAGYEKGWSTYNPALRDPRHQSRDSHGRFKRQNDEL